MTDRHRWWPLNHLAQKILLYTATCKGDLLCWMTRREEVTPTQPLLLRSILDNPTCGRVHLTIHSFTADNTEKVDSFFQFVHHQQHEAHHRPALHRCREHAQRHRRGCSGTNGKNVVSAIKKSTCVLCLNATCS